MSRNYFANKRRRESQKGKPVVHSTLKKIEFSIDDVYYIYEYKTDNTSGFAYIYKGKELIYGPYQKQCTDEGRKIEQLLRENKIL